MRAGVKKYQQASQAEQENKDEKLKEELVLKYAPLVKNIAERMAIRLPPNTVSYTHLTLPTSDLV